MEYNKDKIVIFDWSGIVESHKEGEYNSNKAKENLIKKLNPAANNIIKKWKQCDSDDTGRMISTYNKTEDIEKWYERIKAKFNLKYDLEEFARLYKEEFDNIYFYKDIVELEHMTKQRCKIAILSNLTVLDKSRIDNHLDLKQYDYVWLSCDMEVRKPNKKIYEIVESECKIAKCNILFIDDTEENIETAKLMGWNTCYAYGYEYDKIKNAIKNFFK